MDNNEFQNGSQLEQPMSMGEWLVTIIVSMIPCVGIVMLFVWAFGQGNTNRRNYCRAQLIIAAVGIVLAIILYAILGAAMFAAFNSYGYY